MCGVYCARSVLLMFRKLPRRMPHDFPQPSHSISCCQVARPCSKRFTSLRICGPHLHTFRVGVEHGQHRGVGDGEPWYPPSSSPSSGSLTMQCLYALAHYTFRVAEAFLRVMLVICLFVLLGVEAALRIVATNFFECHLRDQEVFRVHIVVAFPLLVADITCFVDRPKFTLPAQKPQRSAATLVCSLCAVSCCCFACCHRARVRSCFPHLLFEVTQCHEAVFTSTPGQECSF